MHFLKPIKKKRRNGDHFEGHWVNDKREGQGSYFFNQKNQVFVGEWVDDMPKAGVYSEVEDPENPRPERYLKINSNFIANEKKIKEKFLKNFLKLCREINFTDPYYLPILPEIKLKNPTSVLQEAMENVRRERTFYRARFIPLDELYTKEEMQDLLKEFGTGANEKDLLNLINLSAVLLNMNFELTGNFCFLLKIWIL